MLILPWPSVCVCVCGGVSTFPLLVRTPVTLNYPVGLGDGPVALAAPIPKQGRGLGLQHTTSQAVRGPLG